MIVCGTGPTLHGQERTTIGGYGEVHYTNPTGQNRPATANVKRFVVFLGHTFSDRLAFRSELEVEDAKLEGGAPGGEVSLEQLYLDYRLGAGVTIRTGLILVPIGIINETHEPPTFNGIARPAYHHDVLPTTWREIGVGLHGTLGAGFGYRAYLVNGLVGTNFSASEGIRGGRQEGKDATFANPSATGRLEYARPDLKIGAAFWYGGTAAGDPLIGRGTFAAPLGVLAADLRWNRGPVAVRAEAATISVGDAVAINARSGGEVGRRITGGYVEGAVNLLEALVPATTERLNVFGRHERYNTQAAVPRGATADLTNARRVTTAGLTYLPVSAVAFKADYAWIRNRAHLAEGGVFSLGVGFWF